MPRRAVQGLLTRFSREIADLTGRVLRATVAVSGSTSDGGSSGSGFFLDTRGHIVTNHHVIADVQPPIAITLNGGTKALAGVVGVDKIADIAVLTLDGEVAARPAAAALAGAERGDVPGGREPAWPLSGVGDDWRRERPGAHGERGPRPAAL